MSQQLSSQFMTIKLTVLIDDILGFVEILSWSIFYNNPIMRHPPCLQLQKERAAHVTSCISPVMFIFSLIIPWRQHCRQTWGPVQKSARNWRGPGGSFPEKGTAETIPCRCPDGTEAGYIWAYGRAPYTVIKMSNNYKFYEIKGIGINIKNFKRGMLLK